MNMARRCLFIYKNHQKWIIGAIFNEIEKSSGIPIVRNYLPETFRQTFRFCNIRGRFFPKIGEINVYATHKLLFKFGNAISSPKKRVLITQIIDESDFELKKNLEILQSCERFVVQNRFVRDFLLGCGISSEKIHVFPGAIDRQTFYPGTVFNESILMSGDFKVRKNPEAVAQLVRNNPDLEFIIHGKNLKILLDKGLGEASNVELIEWNFSKQPQLIREASVFVSLSKLEGGPFSILEALASGTPAVATDVGIAREYLNGENGFVIPVDFNPEVLRNRILESQQLKKKTAGMDLLEGKFSWADYGNVIFGD
jgi:glycosyltransferase involved in cell wall biosynthesis